jgi:hypothetical protein
VEAFLYDDHEMLSRFHFFNATSKPRWQVDKKSLVMVVGTIITSLEAPEGSDKGQETNWLYVNVVYTSNHGQGALSKSIKISHLCTRGGPPASMMCAKANIDEQYKPP